MDELNLVDYEISKHLAQKDLPFNALIATAARKADSENLLLLQSIFPKLVGDLKKRYNSPGGMLPEDNIQDPVATFERIREVVNSYMRA